MIVDESAGGASKRQQRQRSCGKKRCLSGKRHQKTNGEVRVVIKNKQAGVGGIGNGPVDVQACAVFLSAGL
jgi:hypothetical protein